MAVIKIRQTTQSIVCCSLNYGNFLFIYYITANERQKDTKNDREKKKRYFIERAYLDLTQNEHRCASLIALTIHFVNFLLIPISLWHEWNNKHLIRPRSQLNFFVNSGLPVCSDFFSFQIFTVFVREFLFYLWAVF